MSVPFRSALPIVAIAGAVFYFQWRVGVMNPAFLVYSWIVFAAEIVGLGRTLLFLLSTIRVTHHDVPASLPGNVTVDVFIPTYNEPVEIVRRTVRAALAIRYPHETWLLDDGQRAEMRGLAKETGCHYIVRPEHADAKAGNLNHALTQSSGEFIAIFDADHVADPRFLDRTLGYFSDPRLAFVQTPQEFFNTESFEHLHPKRTLANGASFFHRVVQRSRDASNSTIFSGSSAVLRRRALEEVGGFSTGTISEDVHTSLLLHAAGWRSLFHPEILSAGMAPLSVAAYRGQRLRWAQDSIQLLQREKIINNAGLAPGQRIAYLIHVASNLEGWRHIFIYAMPIAILVSGILPVQTNAASFLIHFVPYLVLLNVAQIELSRGLARPDESAIYNLARCPAALRATFTAHRERQFHVTPKTRALGHATPADVFTYVVLLATLGAIVYACSQALAGRSPFDGATLTVVVAWAAYHAATAVRLLMLEGRCSRDRRTATRFEESFTATITSVDDPQVQFTLHVAGASADGFTLRERSGAPAPKAGTYRSAIDIAGAGFACELTVRESGLGGAAHWTDGAQRERFDLLLHQRAIERFGAA